MNKRHLLGELSFLSRVNHLRITCKQNRNTKGCSKLRTKPFAQSMSITIIIFEENNMVYVHNSKFVVLYKFKNCSISIK